MSLLFTSEPTKSKPGKLVCPIVVRRDEEGKVKVTYDCGPVSKARKVLEKIENPVGGCIVVVEKDEQGKTKVRSVCGPASKLQQLLSQL